MKRNGHQIKKTLINTSSFKHLFNALLISLHSPRNFPTGCCKERRKKICIQHKNMAKQARVYSTTRLTTITCSWQRCSCSIISRQSPWRWGAKEGCIACKNYPLTFKFSRHIAYKQLNCASLQVTTLNRTFSNHAFWVSFVFYRI